MTMSEAVEDDTPPTEAAAPTGDLRDLGFADVDLEDPNFERTPYAEFVAYGRSKTANILFAAIDRDGSMHLELGEVVTANYFSLLGISPVVGRTFLPGDDTAEGGK